MSRLSPSPREDELLQARLDAFLINELKPESLSIKGLRRESYGFSCENWPFDLEWTSRNNGTATEQLILRRDPEASVLVSDRRIEFEVLKALEGYDGVPTPRALWLDKDGTKFGRPSTIMVRCPGACDPMVLSGGTLQLEDPQRLAMAKQFMDTVLAIHRFGWAAAGLDRIFPIPSAGTREAGTHALDHWEGEYRRNAQASFPEYEFILSWLRSNIPVSDQIALVHADFKPGNTLIDKGRLVAVLDWETAHVGDPVEDLGWVTNPLRASEHQIPGKWEAAQMIEYYEASAGRKIDPEALRWWGVFSNFKLLTIWLTGLRAFLSGQADRPMGNPRHHLAVMLFQLGLTVEQR